MTFDEADFKKGQDAADRTIKMCDLLLKDSFMIRVDTQNIVKNNFQSDLYQGSKFVFLLERYKILIV